MFVSCYVKPLLSQLVLWPRLYLLTRFFIKNWIGTSKVRTIIVNIVRRFPLILHFLTTHTPGIVIDRRAEVQGGPKTAQV